MLMWRWERHLDWTAADRVHKEWEKTGVKDMKRSEECYKRSCVNTLIYRRTDFPSFVYGDMITDQNQKNECLYLAFRQCT